MIGPEQRRNEQARDRMFALMEKNWQKNRDVPYEQIERDVDDAVRDVRAKRKHAGGRR